MTNLVPRSEVLANLRIILKQHFLYMKSDEFKDLLSKDPRLEPVTIPQLKMLKSEEVDQLVARYNETKNMRLVAREFRTSVTTVRSHLRILSIEVRRSKPMSEKQKVKAREMWTAGMTSTRIAKKLGFSHHTILRAVRG